MLGQGGMGQVYEATDLELEVEVAIKVIRPDVADREDVVERFKSELELSRRITHPNVCRVFDLFQHHDDAEPWGAPSSSLLLTMELLRGPTLVEALHRFGPPPAPLLWDIARQLASGLAAAHRVGVLHRDLKSSNILLVGPDDSRWPTSSEGALDPAETWPATVRAVLTDFGLARLQDEGRRSSGEGTPGFVSPEVVNGAEVDQRTDLFGLGVTLYHLSTGTRPFEDRSFSQAAARTSWSPMAIRARRSELSLRWENIVGRCLEPDPERRFQSAQDLHDALGPRRVWRRAMPAVVFAVAIGTLIGRPDRWNSLRLTESEPSSSLVSGPAQAEPLPRVASLAVVGFENLRGDPVDDWLGTALGTLLASELAAHGTLGVASGERIHAMRDDLRIEHVASSSAESAQEMGRYLGVDFLLGGSFFTGPSESLRLDIRVMDAHTGAALSQLIVEGQKEDLAGLMLRSGRGLRERLGLGAGVREGIEPGDQGLPQDSEALRLLVQGLEAQRRHELEDATNLLEQAVSLDPDASVLHRQLSKAWMERGYEENARAASRRALETANPEMEYDYLVLQAHDAELRRDWPRSIDLFGRLVEAMPDHEDHSIRLASCLAENGRISEAFGELDRLRSRHQSTGGQPRQEDLELATPWFSPSLELAESKIASLRSDPRRQLDSVRRAIAGARHIGAGGLEAEALLLESSALLQLGKVEASIRSATEALDLLAQRGSALRLA
ncbi:MAG: protein kinase, partial [Thermoanaerobaculia bacterium]|nr:protein kinase [Thermoanaerobaculia bacterium]